MTYRKYKPRGKKKSAGEQALSILRKQRPEMKHFSQLLPALPASTHSAGTAAPFAGTVQNLGNVPQGDSDTTRDGDVITQRHLLFNFDCWRDLTNTVKENMVRLIIFRYKDKAPSYTPPVSELLPDLLVDQHRGWDQRKKYVVYKDVTFNLALNGQTSARARYKINLKSQKGQFDAGTINYLRNSLHCLIIGDQPSNVPIYRFVSRLTFYDN